MVTESGVCVLLGRGIGSRAQRQGACSGWLTEAIWKSGCHDPNSWRKPLATRWCHACIDCDLLTDAGVLVSELATNALLHGKGQITMRAHVDDNRLLIELVDEYSGFQRALRRKNFGQIGGWGLQLVDGIASRWGVHEGTVWFELERAGPRLTEPDRGARH
jgi:hypothetical protein